MPKDNDPSSIALNRNHLQESVVCFNFGEEGTGLKRSEMTRHRSGSEG